MLKENVNEARLSSDGDGKKQIGVAFSKLTAAKGTWNEGELGELEGLNKVTRQHRTQLRGGAVWRRKSFLEKGVVMIGQCGTLYVAEWQSCKRNHM